MFHINPLAPAPDAESLAGAEVTIESLELVDAAD
jgi:hypothetical protein